jgi:polar amino acid transport system substrate-binding protein
MQVTSTTQRAALAAGVLLICLLVWLFAAHDPTLKRVRDTGVLRIGYAVEAPYALLAADGRVTGEAPETARLVAARLGVRRIEWVQTAFDTLITELDEGRYDLVAAGLFVQPARAARVRFSASKLRVGAGLLVRSGNPAGLHSYADAVAGAQVRIAVVAGSVEHESLRARGLPEERLLVVPDADSGRAAVETQAAEALALSLPTTRDMARRSAGRLESVAVGGRASASEAAARFDVAFAFASGHEALARAWDRELATVLGSRAHLEAIAPFGFLPSDLPDRAGQAQVAGR